MGVKNKLSVLVVAVIALSLGQSGKADDPLEEYEVSPTLPFEGVLALNNKLGNSEKLFQGKIMGPEHILFHNGAIYTGVLGQGLIKIVGDQIEPIISFGRPCKLPEEEPICGRVLGIVEDTKVANSLLVADAYFGIFHYNLNTNAVENLVSPNTTLEGWNGPRPSKTFNSIVAAKNGDFYWTSTSSNYQFSEGLYALLDDPTGRLFYYNRETKTNTLLIDKVNFANGVALSPDEGFVIVAETVPGRVTKYNLKGPKAGEAEVFLDGLPGGPDNIQGDEFGIWLAVPLAYDDEHPFISHLLSKNPKARQFFIDLLRFTESPYGLLRRDFPLYVQSAIKGFTGSFEQVGFALFPRTLVLRVDWDGNMIEALYSTDESIQSLSHAVYQDGYLYMGSPFNDFIARHKLEAFKFKVNKYNSFK